MFLKVIVSIEPILDMDGQWISLPELLCEPPDLLLVAPDAVLGEVHLVYQHRAVPVQDLDPVLTAQHKQRAALHWAPDKTKKW